MQAKKYIKKFALNIQNSNNFDFSKNTTYGCGGVAKIAYFPKNTLQAICVFEKIIRHKLNYFILGNGSNVLASNNYFNGVVVSTRYLKGIYKKSANQIYCLAGTTVSQIIQYCKKHNLSGLEYLVKIPATIGGVAYMNGGAGGVYIQNNVNYISLYNGKIVNLHNKICNFRYKYSTMRDIKALILGVNLSVLPNSDNNSEKLIEFYTKRRLHLPKGKSCGCVFKNPTNSSAGKLIEDCNLKGYSIGTATVSCVHANFIINNGSNSTDVYKLIKYVKKCVYDKFNILLEEEVVYVGNDFT